MISQGSRCRVRKQIRVGGQVAFEQGEEVYVESVSPHPQKPQYKYLVSSRTLGKKFLLSDADMAEVPDFTTETDRLKVQEASHPRPVGESQAETPKTVRLAEKPVLTSERISSRKVSRPAKSAKSGSKSRWILAGALILSLIAGAVIFVFLVTGENKPGFRLGKTPLPSSPSRGVPEYKGTPEGITLEEYEKIQNGMTYEEVVEIVGGPGRVLSGYGTPGAEDYAIIYGWVGEEKDGNATVTFHNGRVTAKRQQGL